MKTRSLDREEIVSLNPDHIIRVETPYGPIVAFQSDGRGSPITVVGIYGEELESQGEGASGNKLTRLRVRPIPRSRQREISRLYKVKGYTEEVNFL